MQGDQGTQDRMPWDPENLELGDEFAMQTLPECGPSGEWVLGFVSAAAGEMTCEFVDGADLAGTNPPDPWDCRFVLHTPHQYSVSQFVCIPHMFVVSPFAGLIP